MNIPFASCFASSAAALVVASCAERQSELGITISSLSGEYGVFASLSSPDSPGTDHAHNHVNIHLADDEGNELSSVDTRASPLSKWALGWMHDADIVVLESSDIGYRSFRVEGSQLVDNGRSDAIQLRACELYQKKYERDGGPHCRQMLVE